MSVNVFCSSHFLITSIFQFTKYVQLFPLIFNQEPIWHTCSKDEASETNWHNLLCFSASGIMILRGEISRPPILATRCIGLFFYFLNFWYLMQQSCFQGLLWTMKVWIYLKGKWKPHIHITNFRNFCICIKFHVFKRSNVHSSNWYHYVLKSAS